MDGQLLVAHDLSAVDPAVTLQVSTTWMLAFYELLEREGSIASYRKL